MSWDQVLDAIGKYALSKTDLPPGSHRVRVQVTMVRAEGGDVTFTATVEIPPLARLDPEGTAKGDPCGSCGHPLAGHLAGYGCGAGGGCCKCPVGQ